MARPPTRKTKTSSRKRRRRMRSFGISLSLDTDHSRISKRQTSGQNPNRAEVGVAFGCLAENKTDTQAQNTIGTGPDRDPPTGLYFIRKEGHHFIKCGRVIYYSHILKLSAPVAVGRAKERDQQGQGQSFGG